MGTLGAAVSEIKRRRKMAKWRRQRKKRLESKMRSGSTGWVRRPDLVEEYQRAENSEPRQS